MHVLLLPLATILFTFFAGVSSVSHQNLTVAPPLPILDIGMRHIFSELGETATAAEINYFRNSIAASKTQAMLSIETSGMSRKTRDQAPMSQYTALNRRTSPVMCTTDSPCLDGSCCNTVSDYAWSKSEGLAKIFV